MKTRTVMTVIGLVAGASLTAFPATAMDRYIEQALVGFCESTMDNDRMKLDKSIRAYRLDHQTVASKVVCNGQPIMAFAEYHNADRTLAAFENRLPARLRPVTKIRDITVMTTDDEKWYVTIDENR